MLIPILKKEIDERFLMHRLKSTSLAGVIGALAAAGLWAYDYYGHHVFRWDLFAVLLTMAAVKISAMLWFHFTD
jgi:hypothetical protein